MPSEMSQLQKDKYWMMVTIWPGVVKFTGAGRRTVVARGWGEGNGQLFHGHRVSVLQDEEFSGWTAVMVAQRCECTYCH